MELPLMISPYLRAFLELVVVLLLLGELPWDQLSEMDRESMVHNQWQHHHCMYALQLAGGLQHSPWSQGPLY